MPTVTRVVRDKPGLLGTEDGYVYRWSEAGEAVDVLPQHLTELLSLPGTKKKTVKVKDEPVIRPIFTLATDLPVTLVEPELVPEPVLDLTGVKVKDEPPQAPDPEPDVRVLPAPVDVTPTVAKVKVSDQWSDADLAHLTEHRPDITRGRRR